MTKTGIIIASTLGGVGVATAVAVPTAIVLTQDKGENMENSTQFEELWEMIIVDFKLDKEKLYTFTISYDKQPKVIITDGGNPLDYNKDKLFEELKNKWSNIFTQLDVKYGELEKTYK